MHDLRFAMRQLLKSPGFTCVAVLTLGLGLAANATILNMIRAFFFEPLPVKDAGRLAFVMQKTDLIEFPLGYSWLDFKDLRERVPAFDDALALMASPVNLGAPGQQPERTWIEFVSGNYFSMLGVPPSLGRVFGREEGERPGTEPVAVLSHAYWQRKFGGDPALIGRTIVLNGQAVAVIGVMPESFSGAQWAVGTSAWVPAVAMSRLTEGGAETLENRAMPTFKILARLRPDTSFEEARAATTIVVGQLAQDFPKEHRESRVVLAKEMHSRPEPSLSGFMPLAAVVFVCLVVFVLLIACANVANLMFARALTRLKEMGIRSALGASRWRLLRQLLVESVLLAVLAGVVGAVLAYAFGTVLHGFTPAGDLPVRSHATWSWAGLMLTMLMAVAAGLITGIVPALRATRLDLQSVLKTGGGAVTGEARHPFRSVLVTSQVALCLVVLTCGGLFVESLRQVARADLGFRPDHVLLASMDLGLQRYEAAKGRRFHREALERLKALPGVESVALATHVPFDYGMRMVNVGAEGRAPASGDGREGLLACGYSQVSTDYLPTLGVTLLRGRNFGAADQEGTTPVALVNQTLARLLWGDEDPIGKKLRVGGDGGTREVIGVLRDGKYVMLGEAARPFAYFPLEQDYGSPVTLHLRTSTDPLSLAPAVRQTLAGLDANLPLYNVRTMTEHLRQSALALFPLRMAATLAGVQGLLALGLAVMGVYGVVAYVVGQRTREIGIRVALGAGRFQVVKLVLRDGWRLTLVGLAAGLAVAALLALGLSRLLYGLQPLNVPVFAGATLLVAGVALLASYLPARRALQVDPVLALRSE